MAKKRQARSARKSKKTPARKRAAPRKPAKASKKRSARKKAATRRAKPANRKTSRVAAATAGAGFAGAALGSRLGRGGEE